MAMLRVFSGCDPLPRPAETEQIHDITERVACSPGGGLHKNMEWQFRNILLRTSSFVSSTGRRSSSRINQSGSWPLA